MEQCAIFIDGGYFAKVTEQNFNRPPIDFQRLSDVLSEGAPRLRTYYYDCMPYQGNPPTLRKRKNTRRKQDLSMRCNGPFKDFSFDKEDSGRRD